MDTHVLNTFLVVLAVYIFVKYYKQENFQISKFEIRFDLSSLTNKSEKQQTSASQSTKQNKKVHDRGPPVFYESAYTSPFSEVFLNKSFGRLKTSVDNKMRNGRIFKFLSCVFGTFIWKFIYNKKYVFNEFADLTKSGNFVKISNYWLTFECFDVIINHNVDC